LKLSELNPGEKMGKEVEVSALVLSVTEKIPRIKKALWYCKRCGYDQLYTEAGLKRVLPPNACAKFEEGGCGRDAWKTAFGMIEGGCCWVDERWMTLVEPPDEMKHNRPQITAQVRLTKPEHIGEGAVEQGHYIKVFGQMLILDEADSKGTWKSTPPYYIDASYIQVLNKSDVDISSEDEKRIEEWAASPNPLDGVIIPSIAPDIEGHEDCKAGLACVMFGGVDRQVGAKRMRGTIHLAMFGDPGTAKTMLMKYVHKCMPRSQYTTGPGATDKGLTAVMERDERTGKYKVRAGLLPLAHDSVAMIDEVGQFKEDHWKAIEECMELQQVTRTAGGEHLPMKSRTSVVVAGNPTQGSRWDPHKKLQEQIRIPDSTLSRFDLVFLVLDDVRQDAAIRESIDRYHGVGEAHGRSEIDETMMAKYISMSKKCRPALTEEAAEIFHEAHRKMREEVVDSPFTIRTYESYLRLGQALARMRLSNEITASDAQRAVRIHHSGWAALIEQNDGLASGSQSDKHTAMLNLLEQLDDPSDKSAGVEFKVWARESQLPLDEFQRIVKRLHEDCRIAEIRFNTWKVA